MPLNAMMLTHLWIEGGTGTNPSSFLAGTLHRDWRKPVGRVFLGGKRIVGLQQRDWNFWKNHTPPLILQQKPTMIMIKFTHIGDTVWASENDWRGGFCWSQWSWRGCPWIYQWAGNGKSQDLLHILLQNLFLTLFLQFLPCTWLT